MENNAELVRLEQFVDKLLGKYKKLQEMYAALEATLEERNAEFVKLQEQLSELRSERSKVGNKVAGLIDRIEKWEGELDIEGDEPVSAEELEGVQGSLFAGDAEAAK